MGTQTQIKRKCPQPVIASEQPAKKKQHTRGPPKKGAPEEKQHARGAAQPPAAGQPLHGVRVFFVRGTFAMAATRVRIWEPNLLKAGATVAKDPGDPGITHAVVGDKAGGAATEGEGGMPAGARLIRSEWLEGSLSQAARLPEAPYLVDAAALAPPPPAPPGGEEALPAPMAHKDYRDWLGPRWRPEYAQITSDSEIVMMAAFSTDADERVGNGRIIAGLIELEKYHDALDGDFYREQQYGEAGEQPATQHVVNHRSLSFARVASAVRACAFRIQGAAAEPAALARKLPFVGAARAQQISDLAKTGTTPELEQHRANEQVLSSTGQPYPGAVGSAVRRQFKRLPGVGAATAREWYNLGLRTFEDVEAAARPGGPLALGGERKLSTEAAFSLAHRADLLAGCTPEDVAEMRETILDALNRVAGEGWVIETVGGAIRGVASHDADFVVWHPSLPTEGVVMRLFDDLHARGRLYRKPEAMCQIQDNRMPHHLEKMREEIAGSGSAAPLGNLQADRRVWLVLALPEQEGRMPRHLASMREEVERHEKASFFSLHNLAADRFDHIFGNFRTAAGRVRRLDVIVAPAEEAAFCVLGWSGSRQYLRFLRQYAADRGMHLNSHRLMLKEGGRAYIVPDERPLLDRAGRPAWPPGWGPQRRVRHERDIFELLGLEYRPPPERNAP